MEEGEVEATEVSDATLGNSPSIPDELVRLD
jgi:hypothetical protein